MTLSKNQLKHLLGLAHSIKPVILIGQNGLTESVLNELENAINHHELIKAKLNSDDRAQRKEMIESLLHHSKAELVQYIGKTVTLYRRNPKKPKIELPKT